MGTTKKEDGVDAMIRRRFRAEEAGDARGVARYSDANIAMSMSTTISFVRSRIPYVRKTWARDRELGI